MEDLRTPEEKYGIEKQFNPLEPILRIIVPSNFLGGEPMSLFSHLSMLRPKSQHDMLSFC